MEANDFENIRPYTDEETVAAMERVSRHPMLPVISKYLFPDQPVGSLAQKLRSISSTDEFQDKVMIDVVESIIRNTSAGFTFSGTEHLESLAGHRFLAISNHRDIVLDPALVQYTMFRQGLPYTEICVGSNLLTSKLIEDLMRSNRMIKVIRGISARELYLSSQILSKYIRETITSGKGSVWIAQRAGRTKDGIDVTEQGLLKMFDMSGTGDFVQNFRELNIVPISISYEYEPCDILKAREVLISRTQKYVKTENEDLHSIMIGIKQKKGNVHLNFGTPLNDDEICAASLCDKNDRYQLIRQALDKRIIGGYRLWNTNYIAYDLFNKSFKYAGKYTPEEADAFKAYTEYQLDQVEPTLDRDALRDIFLRIYGNPVLMKEKVEINPA